MSTYEYRALIDAICALAGIADPASMYEMGHFDVNGIPFTLMDGSEVEEGTVLYFCDFGEVPQENRAEILQVLLEANLAMYAKDAPLFSVNFFTKHILLTGRIAIRNTTPQALLEKLDLHAAQARQWRESYLQPERPSGESSSLGRKNSNAVNQKAPRTKSRAH